jgi:integrase
MGRPPLAIATLGKIRTYKEPSGQWTARALFRDVDGKTRPMERTRPTKARSEIALKEAARDRQRAAADATIGPESKITAVAEAWWASFQKLDRSPGTCRNYADRMHQQILPALGGLRCRELTVGVAERFLRTVETHNGAAVAKMTRSVLSNIGAFAARHDALDRNPVRDTTAISVKVKKGPPRSLSLTEARQLRAALSYDDQAIVRDIPDLVDGLLITGLRLGEVTAITWPFVDLATGSVTTGGMVHRLTGQGLIIRREASSKIKERTILLPQWGADLVRRRFASAKDRTAPVFCAALGGIRDPANTEHHLKRAFTNAGFPWLTSHVLRKPVATLMKDAGLTSRDAADQLGHSQVSMTENTYFGRQLHVTKGAAVLEALDFLSPAQ